MVILFLLSLQTKTSEMEKETYTLFELNNLVRLTIEENLCEEYWVVAEVSELRVNRGHCYMQLVQKEEGGNTPIAVARATCWRNNWVLVSSYFERVAGSPLAVGMKVELKVYPQFHEAYGFSWIVVDVNPEYTLGDLAKRRQEIIKQLKAEGVFDMQKQLRLPLFAQRVAVISSSTAAGYGDFCHQLEDNGYGLVFSTHLFTATMQGEQVEKSVIAALDSIYEHVDDYDVVVIIRGGGASVDMSGFDTLALAENVANFPLPVITGIGHDRDECVLDMVSYKRVKTPTAAAAYLVDNLSGVLTTLEECSITITRSVDQRLSLEKERLSRMRSVIPRILSTALEKEKRKVDFLASSLQTNSMRCLAFFNQRLEMRYLSLCQKTKDFITTLRYKLELTSQRVSSLDPKLMLRRGYSMTMCEGRPVNDSSSLKKGSILTSVFLHGSAKSVVEETNKEDNNNDLTLH